MYLVIEGVIGVGKTSLARLIQPVFHADIQLEVFEENPFLSNFYADRQRYAFQTQIFFLLSRYRQQFELTKRDLDKENLISDYSFIKDSIFAALNLDGDELETYHSVHSALAERIPLPDLTVYLQVETDTALKRIALRDREYERNMDPDYIAALNDAYEDHYSSHPENVLAIDTTDLDFVHQPDHLHGIIHRIRAALGIPPFQPELPFSRIG